MPCIAVEEAHRRSVALDCLFAVPLKEICAKDHFSLLREGTFKAEIQLKMHEGHRKLKHSERLERLYVLKCRYRKKSL